MTALQTTVPPLVESPALVLSTVSPAPIALPPEIVCARGFIWVDELAACKPDKDRVQPREALCPVGFHFMTKLEQCIRMKYHPKQVAGKLAKWSPPSKK